ncbi:hypothetical protein SH661x_001821 [Planctomicrobium sp. SH661]|uniref:hypothetical protein n=1 Tax=Planctomicrobium sp. SH661 TaxID=3448124 RepID=UPI003F5B9034
MDIIRTIAGLLRAEIIGAGLLATGIIVPGLHPLTLPLALFLMFISHSRLTT